MGVRRAWDGAYDWRLVQPWLDHPPARFKS